MAKIKLDPKNARLHSKENKELIKKSLEDLKAGRSILIDNEDYIIAGNGVYEQAKELGVKTKVIESDGTELIVVKRTDLNYTDENRRKLAIADNATSETSEWDFEELSDDEIEEWDIEVENEIDYSEKNKEIDVNEFEDKMIIKLEYTETEYLEVKERLSKIAQTPEQAIWKLLNNE